MTSKKLEIKLFEFCRPGKDISGMQFYQRADFLLDGEPLSHAFDFLKGSSFFVNTPLDQIPPPNEVKALFLGVPAEEGQEKKRFVLYQATDVDGGDLGRVSCVIEREGNKVVWKDICSQGLDEAVTYPNLEFDFDDYGAELEDYIERNPATRS